MTPGEGATPRVVCRQKGGSACRREAEWECQGCRKPICRVHHFISDRGPLRRGFRIWSHICATCYAIEQRAQRCATEIAYDERRAFYAYPDVMRLVDDWELAAGDDDTGETRVTDRPDGERTRS